LNEVNYLHGYFVSCYMPYTLAVMLLNGSLMPLLIVE